MKKRVAFGKNRKLFVKCNFVHSWDCVVILYAISPAHKITMTNNFIFLAKAALPTIYLSSKPFSLKL